MRKKKNNRPTFTTFSIVVAANDYNPTILNPDFLAKNEIVPDAWGWKLIGLPLTTPPFATVSYDSQVSVTVDPKKLLIFDGSAPPSKSKIGKLVKKYVETLPHVRYSAVGFNFSNFIEDSGSKALLERLFFKKGAGLVPNNELQDLGVSFVYSLDGGKISLTLNSATQARQTDNQSIPGVAISANFHRDCTIYPSSEQVLGYLGKISSDYKRYETLLRELVE